MSGRAVKKSARPAKAITSSIKADRAYLLGSLCEKIEPNGDRYFSGTLAGMAYLLTPVGSSTSGKKGQRKWNLYVQRAGGSPIKPPSQRSRKSG